MEAIMNERDKRLSRLRRDLAYKVHQKRTLFKEIGLLQEAINELEQAAGEIDARQAGNGEQHDNGQEETDY